VSDALAFDLNRKRSNKADDAVLGMRSLIASLSVLAGHAQSKLQVAVVAMSYSVFLVFVDKVPVRNPRRLRPLLVGVGPFVLHSESLHR
jgi:hypothetical protein